MARGSDIASRLPEKHTEEREQIIEDACRDGKICPIEWVGLPVSHTFPSGERISGTVRVAKKALRIGSPTNWFIPNMSQPTLQRICDSLSGVEAAAAPKGVVMPTAKIMDLAAKAADYEVDPCIQDPGPDMSDTDRMMEHSKCIASAEAGQCGMPNQNGKGWRNTIRLEGHPELSANYGLYAQNARYRGVLGVPLWQPDPGMAHISGIDAPSYPQGYTDYSQVAERLVRRDMHVDGLGERDLVDIARDPKYCWLVSTEGPVTMRHPGVPDPEETQPSPDTRRVRTTTPALTRTLRVRRPMMTGTDVAFVQRLVGAKDDGVYGPKTAAKVKRFQSTHTTARGGPLAVDGIVGPNTREAMLRSVEASASEPPPGSVPKSFDPADVDLIAARYFKRVERQVVHWIVLHSAEASELPTTAEALARYAKSMADGRYASWHWAFDANSATKSVEERFVALHAKKANRYGVGYEHAGYARQNRSEWLDDYSESMLWLSAATAARYTGPKWNIPLDNVVGPSGLKEAYRRIDRGEEVPDDLRGITTHHAVTLGLGGTHVDPGRWEEMNTDEGFPMDTYLEMIAEAA